MSARKFSPASIAWPRKDTQTWNGMKKKNPFTAHSTFTCVCARERSGNRTNHKAKQQQKQKRNEAKYSICSAIINDYKSDCICTQSSEEICFTKSTKRRSMKKKITQFHVVNCNVAQTMKVRLLHAFIFYSLNLLQRKK